MANPVEVLSGYSTPELLEMLDGGVEPRFPVDFRPLTNTPRFVYGNGLGHFDRVFAFELLAYMRQLRINIGIA